MKEAAKVSKIGMRTLKRACEAKLIKAVRLPNNQWRITETALEDFLNNGAIVPLPTEPKKRSRQPEALRKYWQTHKKK